MEKQGQFIQLQPEDQPVCQIFEQLMDAYIAEMNEHSHRPLPPEFQKKWIDSIIAMQGPKDRHLELCEVDGEVIGFLYGKVDHPEHRGYIKPGYGYIMEFYIRPPYRRKGYGRMMLDRLERLFAQDGVRQMYLTADPVTGRPFWLAMGFAPTGEQSPENQLEIYEKQMAAMN